MKGIIARYINTSFFKYENSEKEQNVNLYASEVLTDAQFKQIVMKLKKNLKKKNVTEVGLFKKLEQDNDGFIISYSNVNFQHFNLSYKNFYFFDKINNIVYNMTDFNKNSSFQSNISFLFTKIFY